MDNHNLLQRMVAGELASNTGSIIKALAITGLMGPVVGALVHNAGSVLVIVNSAFLLRWRFSPQGRIRRAHGGSGRGTER